MVAGSIPIKTPAGLAELTTRPRRVSQRHRTVLFLVDGKRSAFEVGSLATQAGVPGNCYDELLELGLIMLPEPPSVLPLLPPLTPPLLPPIDTAVKPADPSHPARSSSSDRATAGADSLLPASRTLYPTLSSDSTLGDPPAPHSWLPSDAGAPGAVEPTVAAARLILLRAVRAEAPLAGSLTLLRLRRARSREDIAALLDEVEARITKPHRLLAASLTLHRVRHLLGASVDSPLASA